LGTGTRKKKSLKVICEYTVCLNILAEKLFVGYGRRCENKHYEIRFMHRVYVHWLN
jgi:hypothetical protein